MAPYDASRVRPASEMPESPPRTARRESLGVGGASATAGGASMTAAGNGGEASDSPPRQRRREDVQRSAEKTELIAEKRKEIGLLKSHTVRDAAVMADLRTQLAMLQPAGAEDADEHQHSA